MYREVALASELREGGDKVCSGCLAPAPAMAGVQVGGVGLISDLRALLSDLGQGEKSA